LNKSFPYVDARDPASKSTLLQGAVEGIVLVKNTNNILPLKAPKVLSLFGYDGPAPRVGAASLTGYYIWGLGYSSVNVTIEEYNARFLSGNVDPANVPNAAYAGTLITGGGSGSNSPAYISSPFEAFSQQAWIDGTWVNWDFVGQDPSPDVNADACIVFINAWAAEGYDRTSLTDEYSDTLVANVASQCPNTIVVIHNAGIRIVDAFYDHPNVTAILYAHLPGQDSGRALVEVCGRTLEERITLIRSC
jgi:beta-glucosidase